MTPWSGTIHRVGENGVTAPRLKNRVEPPMTCNDHWFSGIFLFEAVITEKGEVANLRTVQEPEIRPPCPELGEGIRRAISQWKYEPGRLNGRPVATALVISMTIDVH